MIIYSPLKEIAEWGSMRPLVSKDQLIRVLNRQGQPFGVDWSGPACKVNDSWPCDKTYYQYLGLGAHNGLDMPAIAGTAIYASHDGVVKERSDNSTSGFYIELWDKIQKVKTYYYHNKVNLVVVGQEVKKGDKIAEVDNTGHSLGNHLHFMLKRTDDSGNTIDRDNGYNGAIDPLPFLQFDETNMTEQEVGILYEILDINDPTGEGKKYWINKPLINFLRAFAQNKGKKLTDISNS